MTSSRSFLAATRTMFIAASFVVCVASASAQKVAGPNDTAYRENVFSRNDFAFRDSFFSSERFLFSVGPAWFRHALSNPSAGLGLIDPSSSATTEAAYVGTLRNEYTANMAPLSSPLYRAAAGRSYTPVAPNALNVALVWDGGPTGNGNSISTAANWNPDNVPSTGDILEFDNSFTDVATSLTVSANIGARLVDFANNFNPTNTTVIGTDSAVDRTFTFDSGWALTNSATSGTVTIQPKNGPVTGNLSFRLDGAGTVTVAAGGTIAWNTTITDGSGTGAITKSGAGTLILGGANSYTGSTVVDGGTLVANVGTLVSTSSVTVNSGGTLLLSGNGRHIGANTPVTLNGGTFNTGGFSEPTGIPGGQAINFIGALSLTSTSTIDFGAGAMSILEFAGVGTHTGGTILQLINWNGVPNVGGVGDRLLFSGLATSFTSAYAPNEVSFNGMPGYTVVQFFDGESNPCYEVTALVPIPEPATWIGGALALGASVFLRIRARRKS